MGHHKSPTTPKTKGPITAVLTCPSKRVPMGHSADTICCQKSLKGLPKQQGESSPKGLLNNPRMCHFPIKPELVGAEESQTELPFLP